MHVMDNECPDMVKKYLRDNNIDFQLVPPHVHRMNDAGKAIGTFKDYFLDGLCSVHPDFPMHMWCRLIQLATRTLNPMRPSRINPRLSDEALLNGALDYNKTPLAPPGTKVLLHETPAKCGTWAPHGLGGWYITTFLCRALARTASHGLWNFPSTPSQFPPPRPLTPPSSPLQTWCTP